MQYCLGAQTPYMDAMYIDVRWDRTDTLGEATMRLEYRMHFPSETDPDSSHVDRRIVEIGPGLQKEYSLILETSEMAGHNAWKQTDGAFESHDPDSPVNPFELYITPDGITVIHKTMILGPVLRWQEDTPAFGWQLTSDTCTIMRSGTALAGGYSRIRMAAHLRHLHHHGLPVPEGRNRIPRQGMARLVLSRTAGGQRPV